MTAVADVTSGEMIEEAEPASSPVASANPVTITAGTANVVTTRAAVIASRGASANQVMITVAIASVSRAMITAADANPSLKDYRR